MSTGKFNKNFDVANKTALFLCQTYVTTAFRLINDDSNELCP